MAFFDKLAKKMSKGIEQATFEAEKLVRVNKLKSELSSLRTEVLQVKAVLADQVMELHGAGSLNLPDLEEAIQAVGVLAERAAVREDELLTAQAETYLSKEEAEVPIAPAAVPPVSVPEATTPAGDTEVPSKFCAECGGELKDEAVFCASCGAKVLG